MNGPSRPSRIPAVVVVVLRAVARRLGQAATYLGPLFFEAASYAGRLGADAIHGIRVWQLRRQARKAPERSAHFAGVGERLRTTRTARWAAWHALPASRRMAVRTATAVALAIVLLILFRRPESSPLPVVATIPDAPRSATTVSRVVASTPNFDVDKAAARFKTQLTMTAPQTWTFLTDGPVLAPGSPGDWDDFTVASPWVLKETVDGNPRYRMWYRGCRGMGRERTCAIGHAASPDGLRWTKTLRAVFEPSSAIERRQLHGVTVVRRGGGYLLWYSLSPDLFGTRKSSTLHLATSSDGLRWEAAGEVAEASEQLPYPIEPSVLDVAGTLHLWFVDSLHRLEKDDYARHEGAPFLRHFTSIDGRQWHEGGRHPLGPTGLGRIRVTVEATPSAFHAAAFTRLDERWANLTSANGNEWTIDPASVVSIDSAGGRLGDVSGRITGATAIADTGGMFAWFVTSRRGGREEIRVGFRKES